MIILTMNKCEVRQYLKLHLQDPYHFNIREYNGVISVNIFYLNEVIKTLFYSEFQANEINKNILNNIVFTVKSKIIEKLEEENK